MKKSETAKQKKEQIVSEDEAKRKSAINFLAAEQLKSNKAWFLWFFPLALLSLTNEFSSFDLKRFKDQMPDLNSTQLNEFLLIWRQMYNFLS